MKDNYNDGRGCRDSWKLSLIFMGMTMLFMMVVIYIEASYIDIYGFVLKDWE